MAAELSVEELTAIIKEKGDAIRNGKKAGRTLEELKPFVDELKALKKKLDVLVPKVEETVTFDRAALEDLLKRRFFVCPSFEIYGGVAGLYDLGPPGCAVKTNLLDMWRTHFVLAENMLEIECSILTPSIVLETSGHVARFADFMVKDVKSKQFFRADHLLKAELEKLIEKAKDAKKKEAYQHDLDQIDTYGQKDLAERLAKYNVRAPGTGNELTEPVPFNLMFQTSIGPEGLIAGFLRPETAQGIFVNFLRLLDHNQGRMPFAAAQIGNSYRNEISPRQGLLRVREFTMCEIEHFCKPDQKDHPKFHTVAGVVTRLFPSDNQLSDRRILDITFGDAVSQGLINNQTLGYFLARTYQFLLRAGIKREKLRFRQHLPTEMSHYASDCWDAEVLTSYGWVEVVGHADRSCYDLTQHTSVSKTNLVAHETFDEPRVVKVVEAVPNKAAIGKAHRLGAKDIFSTLAGLSNDAAAALGADLEKDGHVSLNTASGLFRLDKTMLAVKSEEKTICGQNYLPAVIEPSFGIGRIMYCIWEHAFWCRENDPARGVLSLAPWIAPIKCSVFPLSGSEEFVPHVRRIESMLLEMEMSHKVDESSVSIGKRYARTDELGIPFAITVDFETSKDGTVTLRERDSCAQIRGPLEAIVNLVCEMCNGRTTWEAAQARFPVVAAKE